MRPTLCRLVEYRANKDAEPQAAVVTHVWSDDLVNLGVWDANGTPHQVGATSVPRRGTPGDWGGPSWDWPPRVAEPVALPPHRGGTTFIDPAIRPADSVLGHGDPSSEPPRAG